MTLNIGGKEYSDTELATLVKAGMLNIGEKHDPASTTLGSQALHGPFQGGVAGRFGLFSDPHARPERYSAMQRARGFVHLLPAFRSDYHESILEIMTGQTAGSTTNADGFCNDPPTVGALKTCQQKITWSSYYVKTELNAIPLIGQRRSRSDVSAQIVNSGGPTMNPYIPDILFRMADTRDQLSSELFKIGVDLQRTMSVVNIQGQAGTDNNRTGWMIEHNGLDTIIATGKEDAITEVACPAIDSIVQSFNGVSITGQDNAGRSFVEAVTDLFYGLSDRARGVGMTGVQWVIVMRPELFRRVTEVWACNYSTYRCNQTADGEDVAVLSNDGASSFAIQQLRLEMFGGQYLLIDGMQIPVVFSEGIANPAVANNTYACDLFIVPLTWNAQPLTYMEFFPMDNPYAANYANFLDADDHTILNNGMYIVASRSTGFCREFLFGARFRMIIETPFLAGRLDDIVYAYLPETREAIPGTSLYDDGGTTFRT